MAPKKINLQVVDGSVVINSTAIDPVSAAYRVLERAGLFEGDRLARARCIVDLLGGATSSMQVANGLLDMALDIALSDKLETEKESESEVALQHNVHNMIEHIRDYDHEIDLNNESKINMFQISMRSICHEALHALPRASVIQAQNRRMRTSDEQNTARLGKVEVVPYDNEEGLLKLRKKLPPRNSKEQKRKKTPNPANAKFIMCSRADPHTGICTELGVPFGPVLSSRKTTNFYRHQLAHMNAVMPYGNPYANEANVEQHDILPGYDAKKKRRLTR